MKYAVVLCDGMADYPVEALGGKTPMEVAKKPNIDTLASKGEVGLVRTVAEGLKPGSDVANMSVLGFDPKKCYTGRSPLEAVSIGVNMSDADVALRCNLVTLSDEADYGAKTMLDYSGGDISTEEAAQIIETVQQHFGSSEFDFYSGVSYRHCLIVHNGTTQLGKMTPPHDISGRVIGEYLSTSPNAEKLIAMMRESYDILKDHPVNKKRIAEGKLPANSIWLWGEGSRPALPSFEEKYGVKGSIVSAVDLLKGIGICAGMNTPEVEGATGYIDTNFEGKAQAAIDALTKDGCDFVYVHVEAPDEMGHQGLLKEKVQSIEYLDRRLIAPMKKAMEDAGEDFRMLVLPDHPTPIRLRTHTGDPVPYVLYDSTRQRKSIRKYTEAEAEATGNYEPNGYRLIERLLNK